MKKIPYGVFDYEKLIIQDFEYIDKTNYLGMLEDRASTLIYLRPGRFGKTLLTSMMYYYYDINSKNKFKTLFKDTYVYNNPTPNRNSYYVLKFDFSGITTINSTVLGLKEKFKTCVITGIDNFLNYYSLDYDYDKEKDPEEMLKYFLSFVKGQSLKNKLYILIDEYDNFTNGILEGNVELFRNLVSKTGFVKTFYAVIKEYIGLGVVDRFFATGICPVTLNSMTTGFNIATDISMDIEFNSMIGLTHEEVWNLLGEYDKKAQKKIFDIMMKNYDGYLFSSKLNDEKRVFNATLVMYFLDYYERFKSIPEKLYDKNITVNYEKVENIVKLQNNAFYSDILSTTIKDGSIIGYLKDEFNAALDFTRDDIISLLYYFGYLTIKNVNLSGTITFTIPNYIMQETYNNFFLKILSEYNVNPSTTIIDEFLNEIILNGTIEGITKYVSEVLKITDNRMFMKYDEKYIQALYSALLVKNDKFNIYTEYPCKNGGYIDVMIIPRNDVMKNNVMIELKYIKKGEFKKKIFEQLKDEGTLQLKSYEQDERINKNLRKYLVIFSGCDVKLLEEVN